MEKLQRILVIDDEGAILFSYKKLLRSACVEVDVCLSLEDALQLIKDNTYCAIITDLRLSYSESNEGLEIIKYMYEHQPLTPVILLTGYGSDEIKNRAIALGASCYLDKPVQIAGIINVLRAMGVAAGETF